MEACVVCGKDLSKQEFCFARRGGLFCSTACEALVSAFVNPEEDEGIEEIRTADIGIRRNRHYDYS